MWYNIIVLKEKRTNKKRGFQKNWEANFQRKGSESNERFTVAAFCHRSGDRGSRLSENLLEIEKDLVSRGFLRERSLSARQSDTSAGLTGEKQIFCDSFLS